MRVRFGGFHQQWLTIVDQDFHDSNPTSYRRNLNVVDEYHNSEIWLLGEAIVSGGITIGLKIEMEANSNTNEVDKLFAYLSKNTVGRVTVGNENNAAILLRVTAPSGGIGIDDGDVIGGFFRVPEAFILDNTALNVTSLRFGDGDSGKFTYITPDFGGFQAGASFIPQFEGRADNTSLRAADEERGRRFRNGWAGGVRLNRYFGQVGVRASAGVLGGQAAEFLRAPSRGATPKKAGGNDLLAWSLGARFEWAGLNFGGAATWGAGDYGRDGRTGLVQQLNSNGWSVGAAYQYGLYTVGVNYFKSSLNRFAGRGGHSWLDVGTASCTYALGSGIALVGGFFAYDADGEEALGSGEGNRFKQENTGWGVATGLLLSF